MLDGGADGRGVTRMTLLALLLCPSAGMAAGAEPAPAPTQPAVRSAYLLGCGGCHGIDGRSYAPRVPDVAGQAGYFLCTADGRNYLARLPNVDYAHLSDALLAQVMNYVTFTLGAGSAPPSARPFTAGEIGAARAHPLAEASMAAFRAGVVESVLRACPAASALGAYDG